MPAIGVGALLIPTRKALPPARLKEAPVARLAPEAEDWLVKRRSLLPKAAGRSVDLVANALHGIAPALARLPDNSAEAAEARRLIGEHLPRLVDAWLAIPPAHRTAETEAEVSRALGVVGEAVSDLSARLAAGSLDALKVEGRFLESRYSEKGPQSR